MSSFSHPAAEEVAVSMPLAGSRRKEDGEIRELSENNPVATNPTTSSSSINVRSSSSSQSQNNETAEDRLLRWMDYVEDDRKSCFCKLLIGIIVCLVAFVPALLVGVCLMILFLVGVLLLNVGSLKKSRFRDSLNWKIGIIEKLNRLYDPESRFFYHSLLFVSNISTAMLLIVIGLSKSRSPVMNNRLGVLVLGSSIRKWVLLLVYIIYGRLLPTLVFGVLYYRIIDHGSGIKRIQRWLKTNSIRYYVFSMTDRVILIIHISILLRIWSLHFRHKRPEHDQESTVRALSYLNWTIISSLIASVLLLIKQALLYKWMADAVYQKFKTRILRSGFQLYFLAYICGLKLSVLEPEDKHKINEETAGDTETFMKLKMKNHVVSKQADLYDLQEIAQCFQDLSRASSTDDHQDEDIRELVKSCKQMAASDHITEAILMNKFMFDSHDALLFFKELQDNSSQNQVSYNSFEEWMVDVHHNSLTLGYMLLDAKELVNYLNKIMNIVLVIAVIFTWLLLTGIATTKVLVVIASPFVAATFVFGDMCKKSFEGIIFTFVSRPFVVGDKCVIDGNELEVKRMGVLRTKFRRVETSEEFSYSNSELASKVIINTRGELSIDDKVELNLDASTVTAPSIHKLKENIERFLKNNGEKYMSSCQFTVKEIKNNVNITVRYKHMMQGHDATITKWLDKKSSQRSEFLTAIIQMLGDTKISCATTST